jgi:hypothetical protein
MACKRSMDLPKRQSNQRLPVLLVAIAFSSAGPCAASSGTIDGPMGPTSGASISISVRVAPRFTLQSQTVRRFSLIGTLVATQDEGVVCVESNSGTTFTLSQEPADVGSIAPVVGASSSSGTAGASACINVQDQRRQPDIDAPRANAALSLAPRHAVTLLISPL